MEKPLTTRSLGWLAWSIALPLGTLLVTSGVMSIPADTRGVDIAAGREQFTVHCAACHFARPGFPAHHGPNLHDIGRSAGSRRPNQSAAEYILESILDPSEFVAPGGRPGMPPTVAAELSPTEIRNLVGYLASCGAFPDYDEIRNLEIPDRRSGETGPRVIRREDMELAENVLRDKGACLECHSLYSVPEGQSFAPGLFGVGLNDSRALHESVTDPHKEIPEKYRSVKVLLANGQFVTGQLVSRTAERLVLCTRDEQNRLVMRDIPLAEIETDQGRPQIQESTTSLMPEGFDKTLTRGEIEAVINLIRQLN